MMAALNRLNPDQSLSDGGFWLAQAFDNGMDWVYIDEYSVRRGQADIVMPGGGEDNEG